MTDSQAMQAIADFLNVPGPWNGADVCEFVAAIVTATGRTIADNAEEV